MEDVFRRIHQRMVKSPPNRVLEASIPGAILAIQAAMQLFFRTGQRSMVDLACHATILVASLGPFWAIETVRKPLAVASFYCTIGVVTERWIRRLKFYHVCYAFEKYAFGAAWDRFTRSAMGEEVQYALFMKWTPMFGWLSIALYILATACLDILIVETARAFMLIVSSGGHGWFGSSTHSGAAEAEEFKRIMEFRVDVPREVPVGDHELREAWNRGEHDKVAAKIIETLKTSQSWARVVAAKAAKRRGTQGAN